MYDVVLINSKSSELDQYLKIRGVGAHLIAHQARLLGMSAMVLDFIESWTRKDFITAIDKFVGPDTKIFGMSMTWLDLRYNAYDEEYIGDYVANKNINFIVDTVKAKNPDICIVAGGKKIHQAYPEISDLVDHFFEGYSETQFADFLTQKRIFDKFVRYDTEAKGRCDYDFKYSRNVYTPESFVTHRETLALELSRGCRFKCKFCSYPLIGRKDSSSYIKDAQTLRAELIYNYENFGIQKYTIQDDTFNDSAEKVEYFANLFATLPFKIYFWCFLRAEVLVTNPEIIPMLREMGLTETWIGVETFTQKAGKIIGKGMDPDRIKSMFADCGKSWGSDVKITMPQLVGIPGESPAELVENNKWFTDPDCPVHECIHIPLSIRPKALSEFYQTPEISEFDKTYEKYGFNFPWEHKFTGSQSDLADLNKFYYWERDTLTGIPNLLEANILAQDLNDQNAEIIRARCAELPVSIFESSNDDFAMELSNDELRTMPAKMFSVPNDQASFNQMIKRTYINNVLNV